ncbi:hypothetical protein VaNZ11_014346 [Volvox africanus]|uniref:Uncharacterized protein n=1 Tax=Volvox africanus TaxID=51714 RepID=A0ABQ5SJL4_9CHLO|nr:hypothetical protein VaNZ11_014346 [Volvox africanus]
MQRNIKGYAYIQARRDPSPAAGVAKDTGSCLLRLLGNGQQATVSSSNSSLTPAAAAAGAVHVASSVQLSYGATLHSVSNPAGGLGVGPDRCLCPSRIHDKPQEKVGKPEQLSINKHSNGAPALSPLYLLRAPQAAQLPLAATTAQTQKQPLLRQIHRHRWNNDPQPPVDAHEQPQGCHKTLDQPLSQLIQNRVAKDLSPPLCQQQSHCHHRQLHQHLKQLDQQHWHHRQDQRPVTGMPMSRQWQAATSTLEASEANGALLVLGGSRPSHASRKRAGTWMDGERPRVVQPRREQEPERRFNYWDDGGGTWDCDTLGIEEADDGGLRWEGVGTTAVGPRF